MDRFIDCSTIFLFTKSLQLITVKDAKSKLARFLNRDIVFFIYQNASAYWYRPHPSVADPAVDLVVRAVADGGGIEGLAAEAAPETVAVVKAGSRYHLLGRKHLSGTPEIRSKLILISGKKNYGFG
jgi:hypothetical protein